MAAMKPRTGDGPLEVVEEGRSIIMRVPLEGGGRLVVPHALFHDRVADPAARDATTRAVRGLLRAVSEAEDLIPALTGSGDGVLAAVHRPGRR